MRFDKKRAQSVLSASFALAVTLSLTIMSGGWQIVNDNAYAENRVNDPQGDTAFADLDIKGYGFAGGKAYVQVYGTAGGTHGDDVPYPDDDGNGTATAYVIAIKTDSGEVQTWAIDSHEAQHGDVGVGVEWHGHRVHVGDNPDTAAVEPVNCVNEVDEVVHASMQNKKAIFEEMRVRGNNGEMQTVNAVEILAAKTVVLDVEVADPDNPPADALCIALVMDTFDEALS